MVLVDMLTGVELFFPISFVILLGQKLKFCDLSVLLFQGLQSVHGLDLI